MMVRRMRGTHRDDPARGCAFASLGSDAARGGKAVRGAFADVRGFSPLDQVCDYLIVRT